jgi:predicted regulator of Ras-like GTPase activity (Roadblock/LC7/MglB family)
MMDDYDSGQWDALFSGDEDSRVVRAGSSGIISTSVDELRKLPGVNGAVQVGLDGVLQAHAVEGSPEQVAAITASLSTSTRQVGAVMGYKDFDHAMLTFVEGGDPVVIFRHGASFVGLLLDGDIAASHILTRIRERPGA